MKKLLTILAAVGLTATASSAVVSCGTSQNDNEKAVAPQEDGMVSKEFTATFISQPTEQDLVKYFAIKDKDGKELENVSYKFTAKEETNQSNSFAVKLDEKISGTVTVKFKPTRASKEETKATFSIDLKDDAKEKVSDFEPIKITVDVTSVKDVFMNINIKLSGDKIDDIDGQPYYISRPLMIKALTQEEATAIYTTLYGKLNSEDAKAALLQKNTNGELQYNGATEVEITKDNYNKVWTGLTAEQSEANWWQIIPTKHEGKFQIGFYKTDNEHAGAPINGDNVRYWVNLTFEKTN